MGFGKFLGCLVGGAVAIVAAPVVLAGAAVVGTAALAGAATVGTAVAAGAATVGTVAATAGAAVASTTVGSAVVGATAAASTAVASSTVGVAVASAGSAVGTVVTGAGTAVIGAGSAVGSVVAGAGTAVGSAAATVGTVVSSSTVGSAAINVGAKALASEAFVAGAIGSSVTYAGITTVEGVSNMEEAKKIVKNTKSKYGRKRKSLEKWQQNVADDLEELNIMKLEVYSDVIEKNISIIKKITVVKERDIKYRDDHSLDLLINQNQIRDLEVGAVQARQVLESVSKGSGLMYAASAGTVAAMSVIGIASTGTAISSLSGAAAYNATIAALGGGSIASGGGGMAMGHAVLGGITIVPVAIVASYAYAKRSEEALTEAHAYRSKVTKDIEKMQSGIFLMQKYVKPRIKEIRYTISMMGEFGTNRVYPALKKIEEKYEDEQGSISFDKCSEKDQSTIVNSVYYLKKLKDVLAVKVFNEQGELDMDTKQLLMKIHLDPKLTEA